MIRFTLILIATIIHFFGWSQHPEMLSPDGWELEKEKCDVKVFGKTITGYEVTAFKVNGLIEAPVESVFKVVMDIEGYTEWYPNCKVGEVLDQPNEHEQFRRIEFGLPWPFDNRDVLNRAVAHHTEDSIWIDIFDAYDYAPKPKRVYRVGRTEGYWIIEKEDGGQTRLTYAAVGEPGGIPKWIINIFLFDSPLEAVNNIREVVKDPKYADE